ncbi:LexA-binding, inner membrane-associated putative hydrolase [Geotoga petraea]|uniref:LexA-binding, inner membrane-associated putative hydrolase n=2 Tax=Geotoga petraea TaxID=28234 RepID=A0A1G6I7Z4_9BACT|nr:LexA-binding, inner membrane-associated putative hydrolase [Geotoga petraea]
MLPFYIAYEKGDYMPNFKHHITSGILLFPVYYLVFSIVFTLLFDHYPLFNNNELIFSFLLFVIGTDLPDVDHDLSIINKIFRILIVIFSVYYLFEYEYLLRHITNIDDFLIYNIIIIYLGIILGYAFGIVFNSLTRHRGAWHKIHTGIIIGIILFLLNTKFKIEIRIFYSLSLISGFYVHLLLDKYIKIK